MISIRLLGNRLGVIVLSELLVFFVVFLLWQVTAHPMHFETVIIILRKFWMHNVKMKVCT